MALVGKPALVGGKMALAHLFGHDHFAYVRKNWINSVAGVAFGYF